MSGPPPSICLRQAQASSAQPGGSNTDAGQRRSPTGIPWTNLPYKVGANRFSDYLLEFLPWALEYLFLKHEVPPDLCFSLCLFAINKTEVNEWFSFTNFRLKDCWLNVRVQSSST